jgi:hypothetical protein
MHGFASWPSLREHASAEEIASSIHRYRALDESGFHSLAKDIARLTADSINSVLLQNLVTLAKGEKLGSLRLLERSLGTLVSSEEARSAMRY